MQCRKNITVEDNKERMNIANFISLYTNIYSYIVCDEITQNKNDLINSILQHGRVVDKNCCVIFPTSGFPYLILCPRQCKQKVPTTYLAVRTKTIKIFEYENLLFLKLPQITRSNIEHCNQ